MIAIIIIGLWGLKTETVPAGSDRNTWPTGKVLARRVSSCPMDTHFWKKYKENSPNLFLILWENVSSGWLVFNIWLKACLQGVIGPLLLVIHGVQNRHAGEQETSSWDKRNKGNTMLDDTSSLFVFSQCVTCSPVWWILQRAYLKVSEKIMNQTKLCRGTSILYSPEKD